MHKFQSRPQLYRALAAHGIPQRMHGGVERYMFEGVMPGSFLRAVLMNDLVAAVGAADVENLSLLGNYARFLYNELPGRGETSGCWGSREAVEGWVKGHPAKRTQAEVAPIKA